MAVGVSVLPVLTSLYFVMIGLPPGTTLTHTLLPSTTLFRSAGHPLLRAGYPGGGLRAYRPRQGPHAARRPLAARGAQRAHSGRHHHGPAVLLPAGRHHHHRDRVLPSGPRAPHLSAHRPARPPPREVPGDLDHRFGDGC